MDNLKIDDWLQIPGIEIKLQVSTSGGPGGQHANKTSTRVTLRWNLMESPSLRAWQKNRLLEKLSSRLTTKGELIVQVDESRSQLQNLGLARDKLASIIKEGLKRPIPRKKTKPSRSARKKRMDSKKKRGTLKQNRQKPRSGDY